MIPYTKSTHAKVIRIVHCSIVAYIYLISREFYIEITADNDMTIAIIVNQSLYNE